MPLLLKVKILALILIGFTNSFSQSNFDLKPLNYFQNHESMFMNSSSKIFSIGVYPITVLEPITLLGIGLATKNSYLKNQSFEHMASIGLAMGISTILKYSIKRKRPYESHSYLTPMGIENTPSFPSGHTTAAFVTATNLSLTFKKWYVIVPAYAYASFSGLTRMYGRVHYTSDVLVGALIGMGSSFLVHNINKRVFKQTNSSLLR